MPGNLKKIVDLVAEKSILKKTALARMSVLLNEDVTKINDQTPDDPARETRYLDAARQIVGSEIDELRP